MTEFPVLATLPEKDVKDVLVDERLTNAILFTVPAVTTAMDEQEKLSRENEELASKSDSCQPFLSWTCGSLTHPGIAEKNLALQEDLLALRSSTASAYATAQHMKDRWAELENQQAQLYQVSRRPCVSGFGLWVGLTRRLVKLVLAAISTVIPSYASSTFSQRPGQQDRGSRKLFHQQY